MPATIFDFDFLCVGGGAIFFLPFYKTRTMKNIFKGRVHCNHMQNHVSSRMFNFTFSLLTRHVVLVYLPTYYTLFYTFLTHIKKTKTKRQIALFFCIVFFKNCEHQEQIFHLHCIGVSAEALPYTSRYHKKYVENIFWAKFCKCKNTIIYLQYQTPWQQTCD